MRILIALALLLAGSAMASDVRVDGYTRKDGTYVQPHHRTAPDSRRDNNYESIGQVNPYTGREGTRDPYAPPSLPDPYAPPRRNRSGF